MDLVNRITVKKDGVYLSSRDSEEKQQYRSHISESLTKVFMEGGQRALDQKIFVMLDCMEWRQQTVCAGIHELPHRQSKA